MAKNLKLPAWATKAADGAIEVAPSVVYPAFLAELSKSCEGVEQDQYWLEVARRCFTTDLKTIVGTPLHIRILKDEKFALAKHKAGAGADAGVQEFRTHYNRILERRRAA